MASTFAFLSRSCPIVRKNGAAARPMRNGQGQRVYCEASDRSSAATKRLNLVEVLNKESCGYVDPSRETRNWSKAVPFLNKTATFPPPANFAIHTLRIGRGTHVIAFDLQRKQSLRLYAEHGYSFAEKSIQATPRQAASGRSGPR